jgi:signal transduction histidine kinase
VLIYWVLVALGFALLGAVAGRVMYQRQVVRAAEAERRAQRAERLAELGSMTGGLAHEIKNPLSTLGLNAQLIAEAVDELPDEQPIKSRLRARTGALRREAERLRGILQDFLEYAGEVRLDKRPTDVRAMLSDMVDFLTPEAERAGVRLRLDAGSEALTVALDERLIKQALLNLLLNAIQAIGSVGGGAGGGGAGVMTGEVILRARRSGEAGASIEVIDTGPGIAAENLEKVFRPYFTTKSGGTGLGLPTCRRYVEEHGGSLTVSSTVGTGTRFVMSLPG